jgi:hypothetical protein
LILFSSASRLGSVEFCQVLSAQLDGRNSLKLRNILNKWSLTPFSQRSRPRLMESLPVGRVIGSEAPQMPLYPRFGLRLPLTAKSSRGSIIGLDRLLHLQLQPQPQSLLPDHLSITSPSLSSALPILVYCSIKFVDMVLTRPSCRHTNKH